jgi:Cu/Ag efflux pump CusA
VGAVWFLYLRGYNMSIAAPMIGGLTTSFLLELLVCPALYEVRRWDLRHSQKSPMETTNLLQDG